MRIAITGHRPNKLGNDYALTSPLITDIREKLIDIVQEYRSKVLLGVINTEEDVMLITGMALGVDTIFAQVARSCNTGFIAAIPFKGQDRMWAGSAKIRYKRLLADHLCKQIRVVDIERTVNYEEYLNLPETPFIPKKMQDRNIWMVDNCDLLIAVWDGTTGGTKNCIDYATSKGKTIIKINPKEYDSQNTTINSY